MSSCCRSIWSTRPTLFPVLTETRIPRIQWLAKGEAYDDQMIGHKAVPIEQNHKNSFEINNLFSISRRRGNYLQDRNALTSKVKGISVEAQNNLLVMEENRQFAGVMSVKNQRVDIAISSQLGVPGSDVERPLPRGVTYKVGPKSPDFSFALDALHSEIGR